MRWAYYNEHDPAMAAWLRELIAAKLIADGDVDARSIADVSPDDLRGFVQCHFFAGISGWSYALRLAGWPDDQPIWTGSCPCQPFSSAGKGDGAADPRHLWPAWFRLIRECRPHVVAGEQVASVDGLAWFDRVSTDLEGEDYAIGAVDLCAAGVGAFHIRQRLWFVADANEGRCRPYRESRSRAATSRDRPLGSDDRPALAHTSPAGELADAEHAERWPLDLDREDERHGHDSGRAEAHGQPGTRREIRELADANGGQSRLGDVQRGRQHRLRAQSGCPDGRARDRERPEAGELLPERPGECAVGPAGDAGIVGHANLTRCETRHVVGVGNKTRSEQPTQSGIWDDVEWIACRDGKYRPAQSGIFPLVARLPRGMVRGGDPGAPIDPNTSAEARVMRLRGYGNSIVAMVAAEVIGAYMDVSNDQ